MLFESNMSPEKRHFIHAVFIPCVVVLIMFISFVLERGMGLNFRQAGLYPRSISNIGGIFTIGFLHADWSHLANNTLAFMVLATSLYFFYKEIATKVLLIGYIGSGLILWLIGRDGWHIGASGLVYAIAFFLFFSGIIRTHVPLIAISLVVVFLYGSMVWYMFPWQSHNTMSWEGHLAGGLIGSVLSVLFRKQGPQKPIEQWEDEENENETPTTELKS